MDISLIERPFVDATKEDALAFVVAAGQGDVPKVLEMLKRPHNPNTICHFPDSVVRAPAIITACFAGRLEIVRMLIEATGLPVGILCAS